MNGMFSFSAFKAIGGGQGKENHVGLERSPCLGKDAFYRVKIIWR